MNSTNQSIKIKIETGALTPEDLEDLRRWENEGGHPGDKPDFLTSLSLPLPLHNAEIFEVVNSDLVVEDGILYLKAEINILSHH